METATNQLMTRQQQSLEQAKQELQPLKIGESFEGMKACIRLQMLKVGIRASNLPNEEEKAVLLDFIQRHYSQYTTEQISEAFDLAITGQLPINDTGCYENFSCEYFGRIMAGYRAFLINTGKLQKNTDIERHRRQETRAALAPPEADWEPHVLELKKQVQAGKTPDIIPTAIYDWMVRRQLPCRKAESFYEEARAQVTTKLRQEKHDGQMSGRNINAILKDLEVMTQTGTHEKIIVQAKRLAILHYLKNTADA